MTWSRQRCPAGTPQVGQSTEANCFLVKSRILIRTRMLQSSRRTFHFGTLWVLSRHLSGTFRWRDQPQLLTYQSILALWRAFASCREVLRETAGYRITFAHTKGRTRRYQKQSFRTDG